MSAILVDAIDDAVAILRRAGYSVTALELARRCGFAPDLVELAREVLVAELAREAAARAAAGEPPSFTCPRCGLTSYHPKDIDERYCGRCHAFIATCSCIGAHAASCPVAQLLRASGGAR